MPCFRLALPRWPFAKINFHPTAFGLGLTTLMRVGLFVIIAIHGLLTIIPFLSLNWV